MRDADAIEERVQRAREKRERVGRARLGGAAEAGQIDGVHGGARGQRTDVVTPGFREPAQTVHEHDGRTAAFDEIIQREAIDLATPEPQLRHGARILPDRLHPHRRAGRAPRDTETR